MCYAFVFSSQINSSDVVILDSRYHPSVFATDTQLDFGLDFDRAIITHRALFYTVLL